MTRPRGTTALLGWALSALIAVELSAPFISAHSGLNSVDLTLNFSTDGNFSVIVGEGSNAWIESGRFAIRANGKLWVLGHDLVSNTTYGGTGSDKLGAFQSMTIKWHTRDTEQELIHTIFKTYNDLPIIIFQQHFPAGLENTSSSVNGKPASAFPTFGASSQSNAELNYLTLEGSQPGMHTGHFGKKMNYPGGTHGGVPLALFDKSLNTLVISPLDNFMVGIQDTVKEFDDDMVCGINGRVESIPAGFNHSTIMMAGQGIRDTLYAWGGALLKWHGKTRTPVDSDFSVQYLGWWTDNGGYYHYQTETNKTYQQTMLDAKAKLEELKIPARYFQFDSWWYYQEFPRGPVTLWEPRPDVFPGGMSEWLGLPLSLHNRYFAAKNNYSADWFLVKEGEDCALPASKELFDTIMGKTVKWGPGMFQYEQDWLSTTFDRCAFAQTDINAARNWLTYMAQAASDLNVTVQYCMALPNHILQSSALQAVTIARASPDYSASSTQWSIGRTSMVYHAVGVIPFKDCFQTISSNEDGCPHHDKCQETNPTLQALVSTMSTGPIAPADGIQFMNEDTVALLKRTCRWTDGLILKPDVPAMTMDVVFQTVFSDESMDVFDLWHTYSDFGNGVLYHYIIAAVLENPFELTPADVGAPAGSQFVAYDYFEACRMTAESCTFDKLHAFNSSHSLNIVVPKDKGVPTPTGKLPAHPFKYYVLAPVMPNGWTFLGEGMKFAVASKQRFTSMSGDAGQSLKVSLTGTNGEEVSVASVAPSGQVVVTTGAVGASLKVTVECSATGLSAPQCKFSAG